MPYSSATRTEQQMVNGILRPVEVEYMRLDDVPDEVEALAEKLFKVTSRYHGSLTVAFRFQPDAVRDYHHELARVALNELDG